MQFRNRITQMLGIEIPVIQAPMGWIARAPLASAVSNAGGMGIIESNAPSLSFPSFFSLPTNVVSSAARCFHFV